MSSFQRRSSCLEILFDALKSWCCEGMAARQLGSLSAVDLSAALPQFMSDAVGDLFQNVDMNSPPKDEMVFKNLLNPLQWMLFGQDPATALTAFEVQNTHSNFCGKVFKSGEPAYFCK